MQRFRKLSALLVTTAFLFGVGTSPASANSAQTSWSGVNSTGSYVTEEDCPVTVEQELLTFDLSEFPENHDQDEASFLDYSGKVTAQYTFYNPADYTITATLAFPFPDDFTSDFKSGRVTFTSDTEKFTITADGSEIEKQLRHTFFPRYDKFDLERDLKRLRDGFADDPFYSPDLPVTLYTYRIEQLDEETYPDANVAVDLPGTEEGDRRCLLLEQSGEMSSLARGAMRVNAWAEEGMELHLYVIGEPFSQLPEWRFYQDNRTEESEEIDGRLTLVSSETLTFKEFALSRYSPESGILESDWYNAFVDSLNENSWEGSSFIPLFEMASGVLDLSDDLMQWYIYELTLEPGQTLINTVEAPMYPFAINQRDYPTVYRYSFLLSPAQTWTEFGNLEIVINTPFYLYDSNLQGFEKTESGYTLTLNGLPEDGLLFSLSPQLPEENLMIRLSVPILSAAAVLAATAAITVLIRRRKKQPKVPEEPD